MIASPFMTTTMPSSADDDQDDCCALPRQAIETLEPSNLDVG
jgi:hypothetical protein